MIFTLSQLKQHLNTDASLNEILDALTHLGMEVEQVEDYSKKFQDFSVGYIEHAEKHPNADKLQICKVNTKDGILQIVCGAFNARQGIYVVYAPDGSYIPGLEVTLKKTEIRGIQSCGMMLSEREMQLSDDHDGIIELTKSEIGSPVAKALDLDDVLIEISITPNRGDLLGVRGIAKDLATLKIGVLKPLFPFQLPSNSLLNPISSNKIKSEVTFNVNPEISKRFLLRKITGVNNSNKSPKWLQNALEKFGSRSISPIVDITNYVCFMLNQPMHAYDVSKVESSNVIVDFANDNDKALLLDGLEYNFDHTMPLVRFNNQIGALAGVKGGLSTGCDENTKEIYLEAAHFDHKLVAFAKRNTKQNTESSYRYERQIDIVAIQEVMEFATSLIVDICGGDVYEVEEFNTSVPLCKLNVSFNYIKRLSGINFDINQIKDILQQLNFVVEIQENKDDTTFCLTVPSYRNDIDGEHVVVAEIIRIYGSDKLPKIALQSNEKLAYKTDFSRKMIAKRVMASLGFIEQMSMSFIPVTVAKIFNIYDESLELDNPISEDLSIMRGSIIPSLVLSAINNINNSTDSFTIFENHNAYTPEGESIACTSAILVGNKNNQYWLEKDKPFTIWDTKQALFSFLTNIGVNTDNLQINQDDVLSCFHAGLGATLMMGKNPIAYFGKINPMVLEDLGLKQHHNIYAFEVLLDNIPLPKKVNIIKSPYVKSPFTPVHRDFAFVVDKETKALEVIKIIKGVDKKHITDVNVFDIYKGSELPDNKISIAVKVSLESFVSTFTDEELHNLSNKIISAIEKSLNAELRK